MAWDDQYIKAELEHALQKLKGEVDEQICSTLRAILLVNLKRRRIHAYLGENDHVVPLDYVKLVVHTYQELCPYLHNVQVERCSEVWFPLFEKLQGWAFGFLVQRGFVPNRDTGNRARDYATDASTVLLTAHFPYDTAFDPWACSVLQNVCRRRLKEATRPNRREESCVASLDDLEEQFATSSGSLVIKDDEQMQDFCIDLATAFERLPSDLRRQAIHLLYFDGLTYQEAAQVMHKSESSVRQLHMHALQGLRRILF
jgi:RNA polymerase sigma factor (sigma-70 family)